MAGITLATRMAARGRRVALLEAGGFDYSEESQEVYEGPILGRSYFDLDSARLRYLGGTSNHWTGWCRPLDAEDFKARPYIPHSGWPFTKADVDPYLEAASRILEIEPAYEERPLEKSDGRFKEIEFHISPPVNFRDKFEAELRSSEAIDLFLNANLVDVRLDEGSGRVASFQCENYDDPGRRHAFVATTFVLAMGGIETPRLLLNSRDQVPQGIGNEKDLVGRFFMEHFHAHGGLYVADMSTSPYGREEIHLAATAALLDSQRIGNAGLRVGPIERSLPSVKSAVKYHTKRLLCANDVIRDFAQSVASFSCPRPDTAGYLWVASEQVPNPKSRVLLTEETDRFGLRRAGLDWRATDIDRRTIKQMIATFSRYLASNDYGNVRIEDWLLDDEQPIPGVGEDYWLGAGWHHMGTTRMATGPEEGVVDPDCRVFGVGNLFIAGSSVFPTGGHANPTLTIVQLTLRLCDHLDRVLAA